MSRMSRGHSLLDAALAAGLAVAASLVLWPRLGPDLAPLVAAPAAVLSTALFLVPAAVAAGFAPGRLLWAAALAAGLALGLALAEPSQTAGVAGGLRLAALAGMLLYLLGALAALLAPAVGSARAALAWLTAAIAVLGTSPVWLAPVIDLGAPGPVATDALVAANPLTHVAVAAHVDYLRREWFYLYSPLGSLRYAYPSATATLAGCLLAVLLVSWAAYRLQPPRSALA